MATDLNKNESNGGSFSPVATGAGIGLVAGIAAGAVLDNIGLWLTLGWVLGAGIGIVLTWQRK